MVITLVDAAWQWAPLPKRVADRAHLDAYVLTPGPDVPPGTFYVNKTMCRQYLLCLLQLPKLYELGLRRLPHGHKPEHYSRLLEGELVEFPVLRSRQRMSLDVEPPAQSARRGANRNRRVPARGSGTEPHASEEQWWLNPEEEELEEEEATEEELEAEEEEERQPEEDDVQLMEAGSLEDGIARLLEEMFPEQKVLNSEGVSWKKQQQVSVRAMHCVIVLE